MDAVGNPQSTIGYSQWDHPLLAFALGASAFANGLRRDKHVRSLPSRARALQHRSRTLRSFVLIAGFALASTAAAATAGQTSKLPDPKTLAVAASLNADGKLVVGRFDGEVKKVDNGESLLTLSVHVPALPSEPTLGLLMCCHVAGGTCGKYLNWMMNWLKANGILDHYVVVSGQAKGGQWNPAADEPGMKAALSWALATYPIDRRRVFTIGSSSGCIVAGHFAMKHPTIFAGTHTAALGFQFSTTAKASEQPEVYHIIGLADTRNDHVGQARSTYANLKRSGCSFIFRWVEGMGHSFYADPFSPDAYRWLDRKRHVTVPVTESEKKFLAGINEAALANPATWKELVRIGGAPAGEVAARAATSKDKAVRLAFAQAAALANFEAPAIPALLSLTADAETDVRAAAFAGLADLANWRRKAAQDGLLAILSDARRPTEQRAAACGAIGKALELPLRGIVEDLALADGLVMALDDRDEAVRGAAFAPLAKVAADGRGYRADLDSKDRVAPVAAWKTWVEELRKRARSYLGVSGR